MGLQAFASEWLRQGGSQVTSLFGSSLCMRQAEILGSAPRPVRKAGSVFLVTEMAFVITEKIITGELTERNILQIQRLFCLVLFLKNLLSSVLQAVNGWEHQPLMY